MAEKYVREDGQVAVLYSPGYGAGWYTWNTDYPDIIFDEEIVGRILNNTPYDDLIEFVEKKYPDVYSGGLRKIRIEWMTPGTVFIITEYYGSESIRYMGSDSLVA